MANQELPTPELLRKLLIYNAASGVLFWRERDPEYFQPGNRTSAAVAKNWNRKYAGRPAGALGKDGYIRLCIGGRHLKGHRVAWAVHYGKWPARHIDHIDGDPANNSIRNLREVSHAENMANRSMQANNTSGATGVSFAKREGKWEAHMTINRKKKSLGYWATKEEAAAARLRGVQQAHFSPRHGMDYSRIPGWGIQN